MNSQKTPAEQLKLTLFLALVIDLLARPDAAPVTVGAQAAVWSALIDGAAVCILLAYTAKKASCGRPGGLFAWAGWLVLCAAAGETLSVTYRFLRQSAEWSMPFWLFLLLTAGLAVWVCGLGTPAFLRAGGAIAALLALSLALIVFSNLSGMQPEQLSQNNALWISVCKASVTGFRLSPALLGWWVLSSAEKEGTAQNTPPPVGAVLGASVCFALLTIAGEVVMGNFVLQHSQPAYSLARMGSLSVFRRMDSLHAFIWAVLLIQKLVFVLMAAFSLAERRLQKKRTAQGLCGAMAAVFAGAAQLSPAESWDLPLTAAVGALLLAGALAKRRTVA